MSVTLSPLAGCQVSMCPWPLCVDQLSLELSARVVPKRAYASAEQLAAVPYQERKLQWNLVPPPA